jgi:phage repressor protein C with HTH and peptisase S24 domain
LSRRNIREIELLSINPEHPVRQIAMTDVEWLARIVWASQ